MNKWRESLSIVANEKQRLMEEDRQVATITRQCEDSIYSMLNGRNFAEARKYFFYVPDERKCSGVAFIEIYLKRKSFWGFVPKSDSVSGRELEKLRHDYPKLSFGNRVLALQISAGYKVTAFEPTTKFWENPILMVFFDEDDKTANPWFNREQYQSPTFAYLDGEWRLRANDLYRRWVTGECSLGDFLLFFIASKVEEIKRP